MTQTKTHQIAMLVIISCFALQACSSFTKNAHRGLLVGGFTYSAGMKATVDARSQGRITPEQKDEIFELARIYRAAYLSAVDGLLAYKKTQTAVDKQKAQVALEEFSAALQSLISAIQQFSPEFEEVKIHE